MKTSLSAVDFSGKTGLMCWTGVKNELINKVYLKMMASDIKISLPMFPHLLSYSDK